jgi:uncharacterized protein (TIRG00374 family)
LPDKLKKNIFISLGFAAALYLALTVYVNYSSVAKAMMMFNWIWLPVVIALSFGNYCVRFIKWDYYLKLLNIKIGKTDSFAIFMSGLIMSVTPGKMGELLKSYLVKQVCGEPVSKTAPVVFAERITDFVSLVLLALMGAYVFNYGRAVVIGTGLFFLAVLVIISCRRLAGAIIKILSKFRFIEKHTSKLITAYDSSYIMLRPVPLLYMTAISTVSWSLECFGYYLVLINFGINTTVLFAVFVYTFATIAGAVTMLPGGLGVTEGSLTLLLIKRCGAPASLAVSSTLIIRLVTLWFAVLVGIVSVSFYQKRFGRIHTDVQN